MIISTEYDTSLWYMMMVDEKAGKELLDFIKQIPEPLMNNVRKTASQWLKGEIECNTEDTEYCSMDSPSEPDICYYFDLDDEGVLSLMKYKKAIEPQNKGEELIPEEQLFELKLVPMKREATPMLDYERWIGSITNTAKKEYNFDIRPKRYGFKVTRTFQSYNGSILPKRSIPINLKELPDDVTYENIMTMALKH